jgi:hypothetical protein
MKEECTKEFILKYLKEYYEKNKKLPLSKDKEHPFSDKTVGNKFGTWNDALILSKIPLIRNNSVQVNCNHCQKEFTKLFNQFKKSENHFCSRSCNASFNNKIRIRSEETNNKTRLALQKSHKCLICNTFILGSRRKTCTQLCLDKHRKISSVKGGLKGGVASAASQQRRSKNEILFSELCIHHFGQDDIQCNEQIFKDTNGNFWDCDIYIKSLKIAILWDGWYWHYSLNVSKKQKTRDILKRKIILNNGSTYYTIIDKGKFNKEFVKEQFNLFIHKNRFKNVIEYINSLFLQ